MKNHIKTLSIIIALSTSIISCKVSKDVKVPEDAIPVTFRDVSISDSTTSMADLNWKTFFTETTLQKLIDSAIHRNNDLLVAQKNIDIAQLQLKQAKFNNIPNLNLQITSNSTNPSNNSLNGISLNQFLKKEHIEDFTTAASLSWEADIWGKIRNQTKTTLAQYAQSEEAKKALQTTIVAAVSKGFYTLLMLDAQVEIARKNLELNDKTIFMINLQFESGQVSLLGKQQAEAQRLVAAQLIPLLEQNIVIQENALSVLTGGFPKAVERKVMLSTIESKNQLSVGVPSALVSRRPDVKNAELLLQEANAKVGITKASLYPSLTITATGGLNAFEASNWFSLPTSLFGVVAGGITQPLLNGKKLSTQYEIAKVQREKAVIGFRQSVLIATGEVSDALIKIQKIEEQNTKLSLRVKTLQEAIGNADMLFKSGMANYLEVITAQSNLLQSELELVSLKKARLEADVDLYRSLGGGWK